MLNTVPYATQSRSTVKTFRQQVVSIFNQRIFLKPKFVAAKRENSNCLDNKLFLCDCVKRTNGDHCKTRKVARSSLKLERKLD